MDDQQVLLGQLASSIGSPLHVVFPDIVLENIQSFRDVLTRHNVPGQILYAMKANKGESLIEACAYAGIGVDVSSLEELRNALGHGIDGSHIGVTGPSKCRRLMLLAIAHNCLINLDSPQELSQLGFLLQASPYRRARVLLRWRADGKHGVGGQATSRFGMSDIEIDEALSRLATLRRSVILEGISFHLSGYSLPDRAAAILGALSHLERARAQGFDSCAKIDIGGGIPVSYVEESDWRAFNERLSPELFHGNRQFDSFYPYHAKRSGSSFLGALLDHVVARFDTSIAELLRRHHVSLIVEPGRALLDQAGITAFRVRGVKDSGLEYGIVTVEGSSFSLSEQWFGSEFLPDPVLIPAGGNSLGMPPCLACVGGSTCLDSDMLTWRKVAFPTVPQPGDLLVYVNTAGYQMDSNESNFHQIRIPEKVAMSHAARGMTWMLDREFCQADLIAPGDAGAVLGNLFNGFTGGECHEFEESIRLHRQYTDGSDRQPYQRLETATQA